MEKDLTEFVERWKEKCSEIKKECLTKKEAHFIKHGFLKETIYLLGTGEMRVADRVSHDLDLALHIAISNERKAKRKKWKNLLNKFTIRLFNK